MLGEALRPPREDVIENRCCGPLSEPAAPRPDLPRVWREGWARKSWPRRAWRAGLSPSATHLMQLELT